MKTFFLLAVPFIYAVCYISYKMHDQPYQYVSSNELTDLQGIKYADNLTDWQGRRVDSLLMDIYYPTGASPNKKYPLILFCHGGKFTAGDRFSVSAICDEFADKGFIAAALDYRVGYDNSSSSAAAAQEAVYRAIQDAKACLRFLVANANEYRIDTSAIFIGGSSAGASLALETSYINDSVAKIYFRGAYKRLGNVETSGNKLTNTYTIKGIVDMWGDLVSLNLINKNYRSYPTIIFKGEKDVENMGPLIYQRLQKEKTAAVYHLLPDARHPAYDDQFCVEQSTCFLNNVMSGNLYSGEFLYYQPSCR